MKLGPGLFGERHFQRFADVLNLFLAAPLKEPADPIVVWVAEKSIFFAMEQGREALLPFDTRRGSVKPAGNQALVGTQLASQIRLTQVSPLGPFFDEMRTAWLLHGVDARRDAGWP